MDDNKLTIGERIKKLREEKGITQSELRKALGVGRRETIAQWETGERDLKTSATVALADYFGETCDYILRGIPADQLNIYTETGLTAEAVECLKEVSFGTTMAGKYVSEDADVEIDDLLPYQAQYLVDEYVGEDEMAQFEIHYDEPNVAEQRKLLLNSLLSATGIYDNIPNKEDYDKDAVRKYDFTYLMDSITDVYFLVLENRKRDERILAERELREYVKEKITADEAISEDEKAKRLSDLDEFRGTIDMSEDYIDDEGNVKLDLAEAMEFQRYMISKEFLEAVDGLMNM